MVKIIDYKLRQNQKDEPFYTLILEGGIETLVSKETGKPYLTARRASIPATFDEATCKELIGEKLPGTIRKEECAPYEYTLPESGEKVILDHTYVYVPEAVSQEEHVFSDDEELV